MVALVAVFNAANSISVTSPAAASFTFNVPSSVATGTAFNFTVTAIDTMGNVVMGYSGTVHFTSSDDQAVLPADSKLTNGVGNFSATLKPVGGETISATDKANALITGNSSTIIVTGPATNFSVSAPSAATTGVAFNFTVTALDAADSTVVGYGGTVHFTSSDAQAALPANAMLTNGTGTFSATLKTLGGQTINATDTVTASITGTSKPINVVSNAATHFSVKTFPTARAGTSFNFSVTALDAANNTATTYSGTVHFTSTDLKAMVPVNSTLTNGTGTFSATLNTVGRQTITATDTVKSSITGGSVIMVFTGPCLGQGQQCAPGFPPCCPGLTCTAATTRAFCEPAGGASTLKIPSRFSETEAWASRGVSTRRLC